MEEKKQIKMIIPVVILAVLIIVLAGIAAAAGLFGNKKDLLMSAVKNVFSQSADAIEKVWALDGYRDMSADGQFSVETDLSVGNGAQVAMKISKNGDIGGASINVGYYGSSLLQADLYADKEEILLGASELTGMVLCVDRTRLDEDIEWFVEEYDLEEDLADALKSINEESRKDFHAYEEMGQALGRLTGAFSEMYHEMEVKKTNSKNLRIDGKERSCKGYILTISAGQLQELVAVVSEVYGENEAFRFYVDEMLAFSYGYGSQEEFLEDYNPFELLFTFGDRIGEEQKQVVITFYVYGKNLARLLVDFEEEMSAEWNIYGGNFPLENTELTITNGYETSVYSRKGSREEDLYKAEYALEYDGDRTVATLEFHTEKGDFAVDARMDYGLYTLTYVIEGEIDKTVPGSVLTVSIDTFEMNDTELLSGDITFSNEIGEIKKPEGKKQNVLRMTKSDWYGFLMEISGNLYFRE